MRSQLTALVERLSELEDLRVASEVLNWDQQTMMPRRGAATRAEALATVGRIRHEALIAPETGRLLEGAEVELNGAGEADDEELLLLRHVRREWDKARLVPADLAAELARAGSVGQQAWIAARRDDDFAAFAPYLQHNIDLALRYVDCFDGFDEPYDALLDDYEPEMKTTEVARLFSELKAALVPMLAALDGHSVDDACLHETVPVEAQRTLVTDVITRMGFDRSGWRLDDAVHPFATSFGSDDVRITTRWDEQFFPMALFGAMHECGHGLYEAGISPSLQRSPLGHGTSLGVHESQSRMWENMVGRGRSFSHVLAPLVATAGGEALATLDPVTFYRAVNRVSPSLIRVEADEVTYGLHIILRFELEQELLAGRLAVADLPEAWNARMLEYLGIEVPSDSQGVLQDVHWSAGMIGYFPTYALGNMIAGQLWQKVHADIPDLEAQIATGELAGLREWLREHVHQYGSKFTTTELLERTVGEPLQVRPFVDYLRTKLSEVYAIDLA
jgi:carboxypeptidase Taq